MAITPLIVKVTKKTSQYQASRSSNVRFRIPIEYGELPDHSGRQDLAMGHQMKEEMS